MLRIVLFAIAALAVLIWQVWPMIYQVGFTLYIGEGTTQQISLLKMKKVEDTEITIYFKSENEELAHELAETLNAARRLIQQHLGIPLQSLSIVLVPKEAGVGRVSLQGALAIPILVPLSTKHLQDLDFTTDYFIYWVIPHESVELAIASIFYFHDRSSRWIGDGLAQFAGYIVTRELSPNGLDLAMRGEAQRVNKLLGNGNSVYDLAREFLVIKDKRENLLSSNDPRESAGYAVALAFWLDIASRFGNEVIRMFWHRVSQLSRCVLYIICLSHPTAKDAAQILSELTGEDIWHRIQTMDLQEVLRILETDRSEEIPVVIP